MDINTEIQSAIPEMMARIRNETMQRVEREATEAATRVAVEAATQWAKEHLVPEIRAQLEAGKAGLIQAAHESAEGIAEAIKTALIKQAEKSLANSWNLKKVVEGIYS